ncbi:MAG: thiamine pyrophosphate-binding protein [Thermodesulfobacteriota bacterium]
MNTAELLVSLLHQNDVRYIFGVPGGAIEDLNTAIHRSGAITPIVTRHEQGAAFMADGYARLSGKLGVCCATAGPGATNLVTGMACASEDGIPVLALTGQVATSVFGKGAVQESGQEGIDIVSIYRNLTKYSRMFINEQGACSMIEKAIRTALSPPGGPVHLNMPADLMKKEVPPGKPFSPVLKTRLFDPSGIATAAEKLLNAACPLIVAGWGAVLSRGAEELRLLAELLEAPVVTSPKAKGIFPESHPLSLGVIGFAGSPAAKEWITADAVDVLLAVGVSFNEMTTYGWDERLAPQKDLIQVDAAPERIGRNYPATLGLVGDAATILHEIAVAVGQAKASRGTDPAPCRPSPREKISLLQKQHQPPALSGQQERGYHPQMLVTDVQQSFPAETVYFADIGNTMAWAIRHMTIDQPYSFFTCLGFSSMGYAVAAPVGAKLAAPDRPVVALVGDGSFLMNGFEVATAVNYNIPVVWVVFNNAMLGMVYHGRKLFTTQVPEGIPSRFQRVDFVKIAEALGARGIRLGKGERLTKALADDILAAGQPTVIDVWIDEEAVPPIHSRIKTVDKHFG